MPYSISTLPTFSNAAPNLSTSSSYPYSTSGGEVIASGAAFFYNKNRDGKWYLPDFEGDQNNPIVGGSKQERFGNGVAISDTAFVVGAPYFSDFEGKAVAYSYTSAKKP